MDGCERKWFVGIDWATEEHAVCVIDDRDAVIGERTFPHSGTGLDEMCTWLLKGTNAMPSALYVAIEVPHGAVVETLLERGMVVQTRQSGASAIAAVLPANARSRR